MTINTNDLLNSILDSLSRIDHAKLEALPDINLYMDQVITFMEKELYPTKRHEEDPILTKTMVNNYVKNNLLPPPEKKKYSKEHLLLLIFIYYFKNILSINDIQTLLAPITEKYFRTDNEFDLTKVYSEVFSMEHSQIEYLKKDLLKRYNIADQTFQDSPEEDRQFLQQFSFICLLSFDVYCKKLLIEKLVDGMVPPTKHKEKKSKNKS